MRNRKEFIDRVVNKLGYKSSDYIVADESDVHESLYSDFLMSLSGSMGFLLGSFVPNSSSNDIAKQYSENKDYSVITWAVDGGVTIIIPKLSGNENVEGLNIQSLGGVNAFLNTFIESGSVSNENTVVDEPKGETVDHIDLKDYYRLNLPQNRIGRKSDSTLIKELEEAGFKV